MRRLRRLGLGLSLGLLAASLAAGVLELALRTGWIANAQYLRRQASVRGAGAGRSLLILGDSFVEPRGLLARTLAVELVARGWEVHNEATSGTGPFEYLDALRRAGPELRPDVVLLCFYAGNDLTDVLDHPRFEDGGSSEDRSGIAIDRAASRPVLGRLYLYHYLRARLALLRARRADPERLASAGIDPELIDDAREGRVNPYLLQLALHDRGHFLDNVLVEREASVRAWARVEELLGELDETCRELSARLVVVVLPHSIQVSGAQFDFFRRLTFRMDERTLTTSRPQELLRGFCERRGIALLDLLPEFRERAEEGLYLEKDDHFSRRGHEVAAEGILEFLGRGVSGTGADTGSGRGKGR